MFRSVNVLLVLLVFATLVPFNIVLAQEAPASFAQCIVCHGDKGQGNPALNSPAIAGLSVVYISRQLNNFATGKRAASEQDVFGQQMVAVSKQLITNKDVPALAEYVAALTSQEVSQNIQGDMMNGSRYYQAKCGACHGGKAQGNEVFKAPRLSNQFNSYLQRQMDNFVNGTRGYAKEDKLGRQMAMMAKTVNEKELTDILFFISQQK